MKQGGNKPERPSGKGRGYRPAHGVHAMTQKEDAQQAVLTVFRRKRNARTQKAYR